jgi:hypothetical protein
MAIGQQGNEHALNQAFLAQDLTGDMLAQARQLCLSVGGGGVSSWDFRSHVNDSKDERNITGADWVAMMKP